jgi:hypothetical protein
MLQRPLTKKSHIIYQQENIMSKDQISKILNELRTKADVAYKAGDDALTALSTNSGYSKRAILISAAAILVAITVLLSMMTGGIVDCDRLVNDFILYGDNGPYMQELIRSVASDPSQGNTIDREILACVAGS